jgi:hypothetical protein
MNRQYVTGYDFDADSGVLTFCDSVIEPDGVMTVISWSQAGFKDKIVKEKLIGMGWTPPDGSVSWIETSNKHDKIIKALKQAYSLGQVYWQQADSEYSSQWKKADATEAKFDKLVEEIEQLLKEG